MSASISITERKLARSVTYFHHFRDIVMETGDAITGDVLIQFALFGEVVFS